VSQDRRLETWRALADTLPPAQRDAPDGHGACAELVWPGASAVSAVRWRHGTPRLCSLRETSHQPCWSLFLDS
jgi:hypothetical protein